MALAFTAHPTATPNEIRLVAEDDGVPVGLALIQLSPKDHTAKLMSVVVPEAHRGQGYAQHLLKSVEATLKGGGYREIEAWYEADRPYTGLVEHVLHKAGWGPGLPNMLLGRGSKKMDAAPFMRTEPAEGDELFLWSELRADEEAELRSAAWYPSDLGPFPGDTIETLNSLGLRADGKVVGWMINHRLDRETIRYTRLFVHPQHRIKARGVVLFAKSIGIQIAAQDPPYGYFGVKADNALMRRLLERRIAPFLDSLFESRSLMKKL
jgi:GNAT superfamily N-acetyltransferase